MTTSRTSFFVFALLLLSSIMVLAQPIVFTKSSHSVRATTAGYYRYELEDYQFNGTDNFEWNLASALSIGNADVLISNSYKSSANSNYLGALYTDSLFDVVAAGRGYYWDSYFAQNDAGFAEIGGGRDIGENFYIGDLSGNAGDTLSIPAQIIAYSAPRMVVAYPATAGSSWKSSFRKVANFTLSLGAYGLNKAPMAKVSNYTYSDSVVAWGKIQVPIIGGKVSKPYDVLMVKRKIVRVDSIYLNGIAAPAQLMAAFGLSQGTTTMSHNYFAWRTDAPNYLLNLSYGNDASYSLKPVLFISNLVEVGSATGVEEQGGIATMASPNPASESINIRFSKETDAPWTIEVYSSLGEKVERKLISAGYGNVELSYNVSKVAAGSYRYVIRDENNRIKATQSFVVVR